VESGYCVQSQLDLLADMPETTRFLPPGTLTSDVILMLEPHRKHPTPQRPYLLPTIGTSFLGKTGLG